MTLDPEHLNRILAEEDIRTPPSNEGPAFHCPGCGYNITGLYSRRCPECGRTIRMREVRRLAADLAWKAMEVEGLNGAMLVGLKIAAVGFALWGLGQALGIAGGAAPFLGRICGMIAGLVSFLLGMGYIRVFRLPLAARQRLSEQPNPLLALGSVGLGLILMLLAFV